MMELEESVMLMTMIQVLVSIGRHRQWFNSTQIIRVYSELAAKCVSVFLLEQLLFCHWKLQSTESEKVLEMSHSVLVSTNRQ